MIRNKALQVIRLCYIYAIKPVLFLFDPEDVHRWITHLGALLGELPWPVKKIARYPALSQTLHDIYFTSPIGLAAGFDYEARLTKILPHLGFGFGTVGTLTNMPYGGNTKPMLGRLPRSKSLMVNKGFKNKGITQTLYPLSGHTMLYPVGVSIGKTNTLEIRTQHEAVSDIVAAFTKAEASKVAFAYYELNISCPNLMGSIDFYDPKHLKELLDGIARLELTRPVFVKMPISKTDQDVLSIMEVVSTYPYIKGVIIGNLQKNRDTPGLVPEEVARFQTGNFSGLPCKERSNELIELVYKKYGSQMTVIGCGGVFTAEDAYEKIKLGASLVQLITGLIYEGPGLVAEINTGIDTLLARDGYQHISDAIGVLTHDE